MHWILHPLHRKRFQIQCRPPVENVSTQKSAACTLRTPPGAFDACTSTPSVIPVKLANLVGRAKPRMLAPPNLENLVVAPESAFLGTASNRNQAAMLAFPKLLLLKRRPTMLFSLLLLGALAMAQLSLLSPMLLWHPQFPRQRRCRFSCNKICCSSNFKCKCACCRS